MRVLGPDHPDTLTSRNSRTRFVLFRPPDTRERVRRSLRPLEQFPRIGRQLEGRWKPLRFIFGPWRWMPILYSYEESDDLVLVVAFQDARSSSSATSS